MKLCPFIDGPCRGRQCMMAVYLGSDADDEGAIWRCGLINNHYIYGFYKASTIETDGRRGDG